MPVFTATGPISAHVRVPGGSCTITATESPDVSVTLTPAVPLLAGDRHAVAATAVSFEGGLLRVAVPAVKVTQVLGVPRGRVHVAVRVPAGSAVDFGSVSADLDVRGTLSALSAETGSGSVHAEQVTGSTRVGSSSGTVTMDRIAGRSAITTKSGHITIGHATGTLESRSSSGHIALGAGAGEAAVRTGSGRVTVRVDDGVAVDSAIASSSGSVRGDLAWACAGEGAEGEGKGASGGYRGGGERNGGPGLRLAVTTASGRVSVSRA